MPEALEILDLLRSELLTSLACASSRDEHLRIQFHIQRVDELKSLLIQP